MKPKYLIVVTSEYDSAMLETHLELVESNDWKLFATAGEKLIFRKMVPADSTQRLYAGLYQCDPGYRGSNRQ